MTDKDGRHGSEGSTKVNFLEYLVEEGEGRLGKGVGWAGEAGTGSLATHRSPTPGSASPEVRRLCGLRASSAWREEGEATLRRGRWAGLTLGGTWGKCCGLWGECPESNRTRIGSSFGSKTCARAGGA